ncbi:MAG: L-2-amino-thiazoline-4-carboxylic acid hydrolase [Promethearchaeota archaeon]
MSNEKEKNYYIKKKRTIMRTFDAATTITKEILIEYFGEAKSKEIVSKARTDFETLLPQIPYVGGKDNRLTESLLSGVILLPLLRIFDKERLDFNAIGKLTYDIFEAFYKVIPPTEDIFSEEYINQEKESAKNSKTRKYLGDWVYNFVEGDGKTFTFGIDYFECGIHKFYKSQGLEHLMPILCIADFAKAQAYGYGLARTQTIGNGAPLCDFRYIKNGSSPRAWPPDNLPEFTNKNKE